MCAAFNWLVKGADYTLPHRKHQPDPERAGGPPAFASAAVLRLKADPARAIHSGVESWILWVPHSSHRLRREGWDGFELRSESGNLRKENFKFEI